MNTTKRCSSEVREREPFGWPCLTSYDRQRIEDLERENRDLKRTNEIL